MAARLGMGENPLNPIHRRSLRSGIRTTALTARCITLTARYIGIHEREDKTKTIDKRTSTQESEWTNGQITDVPPREYDKPSCRPEQGVKTSFLFEPPPPPLPPAGTEFRAL